MKCIDISSNNHNGAVFNWPDAKAAGYDAVYIKATQNNDYLNPYLIEDCKAARDAGFNIGIYHFYGSSSGSAGPQAQAEWFKKNGIDQVAQYTNLHPVVDVEIGTPGAQLQIDVETFVTALAPLTVGHYVNRSFNDAMPCLDSYFGWLAWPGWTNEPVEEFIVMVQNEQVVVPGIGEDVNGRTNITDVSVILNPSVIGINEVPQTPVDILKEVDKKMVSTIELANGDIVTYVLLPSNEHLLEFTRKKDTAGLTAGNGNMSIIDITDEFPKTVPA